MQDSNTHSTGFWWIGRDVRRHARTARPRRFVALLVAILARFPRPEDNVADRYSGCGWCDDTEGRLLYEIAGRNAARLG